ncbi:MAG: hypothetical protein KDI36_03185 [Pseudomonadales bacterium]|nr:hypothetical protein [Pseudomonadales bacterium]
MLIRILYQSLLTLTGALPLTMQQRLGSLLGWLIWISRGRMYEVTRENIDIAFPELTEADRLRLARSSVINTGKTITETAFAWTAKPQRCLDAIVEVSGEDSVRQARAAGRGIIFVMPHLGNWELINHYLGKHYGLTHMFQPNKSPTLNRLIQSWRSRTGTQFVPDNLQGIRAQIRTLRNRGCIGTMPDQEPDVFTGEFARFFGIQSLTSELIPRIAVQTDAAVFTATCIRTPEPGRFRIDFVPLSLAEDGLQAETGTVLPPLERLNLGIEAMVRATPAQYLWSYKRFRTRPAGEPEIYYPRESPLKNALTRTVLFVTLHLLALLPLPRVHRLGYFAGTLLRLRKGRKYQTTVKNLRVCHDLSAATPATETSIQSGNSPVSSSGHRLADLVTASLHETGKTLLETGFAWKAGNRRFNRAVYEISCQTYLQGQPRGAIILIPPQGNREVMIRYLAGHGLTTEYYHPDDNPSLNLMIRQQRNGWGIGLAPHSDQGIEICLTTLKKGGQVLLCPDQQPRLRGGAFVPFFGCLGLTTLALPQLLASSGSQLFMATAIRTPTGFDLHIDPLTYRSSTPESMLTDINQQFAQIILRHPEQYRWSDKRFNIRPQGEPRIY